MTIAVMVVFSVTIHGWDFEASYSTGWNVISLPGDPIVTDVDSWETYVGSEWMCYYNSVDKIWSCGSMGKYFFRNKAMALVAYFSSSKNITYSIDYYDEEDVFEFIANEGWTLVRMPYHEDIKWSDESIQTCDGALSASQKVNSTIIDFTGKDYSPVLYGDVIKPGHAYWLYSSEPCKIYITLNPYEEPPSPPEAGAAFLKYLPHTKGTWWKYWYRGFDADNSTETDDITYPYIEMSGYPSDVTEYPDDYVLYTVTENTTYPNGLVTATIERDAQCPIYWPECYDVHPNGRITSDNILYPTVNGFYFGDDGHSMTIGYVGRPFLASNINKGYSWISEQLTVYPGVEEYLPECEITGTSETISVLAGTFNNCLLVSCLSFDITNIYVEQYIWFCPNVGIVKDLFYREYYKLIEVGVNELQSYHIE